MKAKINYMQLLLSCGYFFEGKLLLHCDSTGVLHNASVNFVAKAVQ